jgi:hypothetical protein
MPVTFAFSQLMTCNAGPNDDQDKDGWTIAQGDCNDCDPNVNPGAIYVLHTQDGGTPKWGDEDCDGTPGDSAKPCDQGFALGDVNAADAAKAIELCHAAKPTDKNFGVLSAAYVRADGSTFSSPGLQVGLEPGWGPNVKVQAGKTMLVLSTGHARSIGQSGACGSLTCTENATGKAPPGFPQANPACPPMSTITDDVALQVKLRAPTNATGYSTSSSTRSSTRSRSATNTTTSSSRSFRPRRRAPSTGTSRSTARTSPSVWTWATSTCATRARRRCLPIAARMPAAAARRSRTPTVHWARAS